MKGRRNKGFAPIIIIGIIALVIIAGVAGYLIWENSGASQTLPQSLSRVQQLTLNSSTDLSSWQTYKNQQYGFLFKYPADWIIGSSTDAITLDSAPGKSLHDVLINFDINPGNFIPEQYYTGHYGPAFWGCFNCSVGSQHLIKIGDISAYIIQPSDFITKSNEWYIIIPRNGYFVRMTVSTNDVTFKQILSTISFTSSSYDILGWKTYTDMANGFTMLYPSMIGGWPAAVVTDSNAIELNVVVGTSPVPAFSIEFATSSDNKKIAVVSLAQNTYLYDAGFSDDEITQLSQSIANTFIFH